MISKATSIAIGTLTHTVNYNGTNFVLCALDIRKPVPKALIPLCNSLNLVFSSCVPRSLLASMAQVSIVSCRNISGTNSMSGLMAFLYLISCSEIVLELLCQALIPTSTISILPFYYIEVVIIFR